MYILDVKTNLASFIIPSGAGNTVTIFSEFSVIPEGSSTPQLTIGKTGDIVLGDPNSTSNNVIVNAGMSTSFRQLTDPDTEYLMTKNDYAIEVISDTYNVIRLPSALDIGGRTYVISRGSNNNNLSVRTQVNENIDTRTQILLKRKNDHIKVSSNGIDSWYVI